ncbi:SDR family oxidoreductase [Adhaeribacter sp. BT258]|uniref:SDR family oxidoreductase n=1 Tax=Adhaeribacter terrigena TaxID=2793070 RepID=A0ABS1C174_9BACT|nr:SDR family oxidoreductase [Adhaeribacter terrigena]MBK0403112.1 SDR family oxidoreductase [Adhaeribacter terrigena]
MFDPEKLTSQSLANKIAVVTGASSGIGKITARELARLGAQVLMICRNPEKGESARQEIMAKTGNQNVMLFQADLSLMREVRRVAKEINDKFPRLDILINNAGMMPGKRTVTSEGFELSWATNYLSVFLLTNLLLDKLMAAESARIINVSSEVHRLGQINLQDMHKPGKYSSITAYADSKLATIMFTYELARRLELTGITANCLHPGVVATNVTGQAHTAMKYLFMLGRPFMRSAEKGAETTLFLATSPTLTGVSGLYYKNKKAVRSSGQSYNPAIARRLWTQTEKQTGFQA